jgi:Glucose-6-phosphate dehydrogenase, NAD binding domain/Glucose-6-phosphate dehydrogenase, C-terminal domain
MIAAAPTTDGSVNPLREGLPPSDRIDEPCSIVFFGASGDLFKRMLLPAVYAMRCNGTLPTDFALVGFARTPYDDAGFREYCRQQLDEFMPPDRKPEGALWDDFARRISYVTADFKGTQDFLKLKDALARNDAEFGTGGNRLFYLATPPSVFPVVIQHLKKAGLESHDANGSWTRIVVEKPFGTDLESARALQREIERVFPESAVYRIDHYLGKEPVQDIIALRFANTIFEPIWNRNYVSNVQITAAESLGVEERGGYYDHAGALRDMIQNHVINLLALVAMEPPIGSHADDIRSEKYKVLSAIVPPGARAVRPRHDRRRAGQGVPSGARRRAGFEHRDVRGRQVLREQLAMGRRTVLLALRQTPRAQDVGDRRHLQADPAPFLRRLDRRHQAEPAGHQDSARRRHRDALRSQGPRTEGSRPQRVHGFQLRQRLRNGLAAGVRAADRRRNARRSNPVHPLGCGRTRLGAGDADPRGLEEHQGLLVPELCRRQSGSAVREQAVRGLAAPVSARRRCTP